MSRAAPLQGVTVVDTSRMLPGATLARSLIDLGARLIKVEDPRGGDPLRAAPPTVDGIGIGFCAFYRGAESVALDLRSDAGREGMALLLRTADVFIESFRPGTLDKWGIDVAAAEKLNPGLVVCSLPGLAQNAPDAVAHDLNITALSGLLSRVRPAGAEDPDGGTIPRVQLADVTTGLLACSSILAALLTRSRDGRGGRISQPMIAAPLPFMTWAWADQAAQPPASPNMNDDILSGRVPCYRNYRCADGKSLSVGCLEPKFWIRFVQLLGLPDLATVGLALGEAGARATGQVAQLIETKPLAHWLGLVADEALPVTAAHDLQAAMNERLILDAELLEALPLPDGRTIMVPGPALPSVGSTPNRPAPALGADTERIIREFGG
jgi:crotonobetainyl-CoA:carnitine CoA-transferase CaiB-like acyl-CoA transferase